MSRVDDIADPKNWPGWPSKLYRIARRRFLAEARRRQMRRFAELDPRFAADIGLTADEVLQGRPEAKAQETRRGCEV